MTCLRLVVLPVATGWRRWQSSVRWRADTMRPDSDIDLLLVIRDLPCGRMARVREFEAVESTLKPATMAAEKAGGHTSLSPIFKTPGELLRGGFIFLDMTDQARILVDDRRVLTDYLAALFGVEAYADIMCEAQELVELGLKGLLRSVGIDPPKWHDVGRIMLDNAALFPAALQVALPRMARISARLRKERELSFYGEIDFMPEENYSRADAQSVIADVDWILAHLPSL